MVNWGMWKMIIIVFNLLSPVSTLPTPSAGYYYDTTTIDYDVADFDEFGVDPGVTDYPNYDNTPSNQDSQPVDAAYDYSIGFGAGTGPDYLGPPFDGTVDSVIVGANPVPTPGVAISEEGDDGPNRDQSPDDYYNDNADENASPDENTTPYPDFVEYTTGSSNADKQPNADNTGMDDTTSVNTKMGETTSNSGYATPMYATTGSPFNIPNDDNGESETSNDINVNTNDVSEKPELNESDSMHASSDKRVGNESKTNEGAATPVEKTAFKGTTESPSENMQAANSDYVELGSYSAISNENTASAESYNSAESHDDASYSTDSLGSDSLELAVLNDSFTGAESNSISEDTESVNTSPESGESKEDKIPTEKQGIDGDSNNDSGNSSESSQSTDTSSESSKSSEANIGVSANIGSDSTESNADSNISVIDSAEKSNSSDSSASIETSSASSDVDNSSSESVSHESGMSDSESNSSSGDSDSNSSNQSDDSTDSSKSRTNDDSTESSSESTESISFASSSHSSASTESLSQSSEESDSIEQCFRGSDSHHDLCGLVRSIKMVCVVHFPKDCFLKHTFPWSTEWDSKQNSSSVDSEDSKSGSKSNSISNAFSEETFELESLSASFENVGGISELMSLIRSSCPVICQASDKVSREMNSVDTDGDSDESDDIDDDADDDDDLEDDDDDSAEYDDEHDTDDYDSTEADPDNYSNDEYEDALSEKSGVESADSGEDLSNVGKDIDESDSEESLKESVSENSVGANSDTSISSTEVSADNESNTDDTRSIGTYSSFEYPDKNSNSDAISDEDNK